MTTRRTVLAGLGAAGVAGLAGCSDLPILDRNGGQRDVSLPSDVAGDLEWPASPFPVAVPDAFGTRHRDRARELLAAVPEDPSVPNGAVAEELRSDRASAADRLAADVEAPWALEALSEWRDRRESAAAVRGAYRAATGTDDAERVLERRQAIQADLGSVVADHAYRGSTPLEAVLVHAPLEDLLADCRRYVRPVPGYPADPLARPFEAGDAVGSLEAARAALADARRLREASLRGREDAPAQWTALIDALDRLRLAVGRTSSRVDAFLDVEEPPFETDVEGTPAAALFESARRAVTSTTEAANERRSAGEYANAALESARALAASEAFRVAIEGIRNGAYREPVTVGSVRRAAERARRAITAIEDSDHRRLGTSIVRPALDVFDGVPESIERGYYDPVDVQGALVRVELYASATPAAAAFAAERLEG